MERDGIVHDTSALYEHGALGLPHKASYAPSSSVPLVRCRNRWCRVWLSNASATPCHQCGADHPSQ